jgi:hypothetical protein
MGGDGVKLLVKLRRAKTRQREKQFAQTFAGNAASRQRRGGGREAI